MTNHRSASALLAQELVEELYRRRAVFGLVTAMAFVLGAIAIGLQVWGPAATTQAVPIVVNAGVLDDAKNVDVVPDSFSTPAEEPESIKASELWITPNSASGARVWTDSDNPAQSPTTTSE